MSELILKAKENNISALSKSLQKILSEQSETEQCLAVQALGRLPYKENIEVLIEHLRNPDEDVRFDVGKAFCYMKDESLKAPLLENLIQDPIGEAKVIYIKALENQNAYEVADILFALVKGRGEKENIAWEEDGSGWDDWLDVQIAAIKTLSFFSNNIDQKKAIAAILEALNDPEGQDLWAIATKALVKFGDAGSNALLDLMREASSLNRKRIAIALGEGTSELSASILETAMQDPDINVRIAAIESGAKRGLKEIYTLGIGDGSADVKAKILTEFDNLDDKILSIALDDLQEKVQIAACEAIIKDKKTRPSLNLVKKAEALLRKDQPKLLSALIGAMAIAKPSGAAEFIEDILSNSATPFAARLAGFRAMGELNSSKSIALLSNACSDNNQEIRLAAIGSLGKIATGEGENANKSIEILSAAIAGELVEIPEDWQPEEDNILDFKKHKSQRDEFDQDERKVRLDSEGNIIETKHEPIKQTPIAEPEQLAEPLSTLDAIMAANVEVPSCEDAVEIDEADIAFLEMTGTAPKKRKKQNPESSIPAHIDVRRLASLVGGETGKEELLDALMSAANDSDIELCQTALDGLLSLAKSGVDISEAQRILLSHATTGEASVSFRAIRALAFLKASIVAKVIAKLCNDENNMVRAEAIKASKSFNIKLDLISLCKNGERKTRVAAADLITEQASQKAIPALFGFAFVEDGVHKAHAAKLLKTHAEPAYDVIVDLISSKKSIKRMIALEILNAMLKQGAFSSSAI